MIARACCEAGVQRLPASQYPTNADDVSARTLDARGNFSGYANLISVNRRYGRKFQSESFVG